MLSAGKQRRMSGPCPASSWCSGGTMHPEVSWVSREASACLRAPDPAVGTGTALFWQHWPSVSLSCPSPFGVQSGFWDLPHPLQVFVAEPPWARLPSLWTGEGSEAGSLFSVASLAPSISLARGGVSGKLGLEPEDLRSGPGPWAVSTACFESCHQVSRTSCSGCPADGEQLPPAAT